LLLNTATIAILCKTSIVFSESHQTTEFRELEFKSRGTESGNSSCHEELHRTHDTWSGAHATNRKTA